MIKPRNIVPRTCVVGAHTVLAHGVKGVLMGILSGSY